MRRAPVIICVLVIVFFVVVATGPAGLEWRERRRAELDAPVARVMYLPSASCTARTTNND